MLRPELLEYGQKEWIKRFCGLFSFLDSFFRVLKVRLQKVIIQNVFFVVQMMRVVAASPLAKLLP